MADVFISYAKQERQITADLAKYLEEQGYTVWWDTDLVSGENFRHNIDEELDAAKAVIVVWTPASVKRDWVISEAEHAARRGALIPVRTSDLDPGLIPKPYNTRHTEPIDNRDGIIAALKRLNVVPRYAPDAAGSLHDRFWGLIENSGNADDYEFYLKEFPEGQHAAIARLKIMQLRRIPEKKPEAVVEPAAAKRDSTIHLGQALVFGLVSFVGAGIVGAALWYGVLAQSRTEVLAKLDNVLSVLQRPIDADDQDWKKADAGGLIRSWQWYLNRRPIGLHVAEAEERIKSRRDAGRVIGTLDGHEAPVVNIQSDGTTLVTLDESGSQIIWDLASRSIRYRARLPVSESKGASPIYKIDKLKCGTTLSAGEKVKIQTDTCGMGWIEFQYNGKVLRLTGSFSESQAEVAVVGPDLLMFAQNKIVYLIFMGKNSVEKLADSAIPAFYLDSARPLLLLARDRDVVIRSPDKKELVTLRGNKSAVRSLFVSSDGAIAISGADDGTVRLWDVSDF